MANVEQQSVGMEVPAKRSRVDSNNPTIELADNAKPQIDLKQDIKSRVILFIAQSHQALHKAIMIEQDPEMRNVDVGIQIHRIFFSVYNILKQKANGYEAKKEAAMTTTGAVVVYEGSRYTKDYDAVKKIVVDTATANELKFEPNYKNSWYRTANSFMNFLDLFGLRINEQRVGIKNLKVGRFEPKLIEMFGIDGRLEVLYEGITFPLEKKLAMAQYLGPLTCLWMLCRSTDKYLMKWKNACLNVMRKIPRIKEIINLLPGKNIYELQDLFRVIGELFIVGAYRQPLHVAFPPNVFSRLFTADNNSIIGLEETITRTQLLSEFAFLGKGAFIAVRIACGYTLAMAGKGLDAGKAQQITFHAMFGTHRDNLSILSHITDQGNWYKHSQIAEVYEENSTANEITFELINFHYFYEIFPETQLDFVTESKPKPYRSAQICSVPCFSGYTIRHFSDEFFFQIFGEEKIVVGINGHLSNLRKYYTNLNDDIKVKNNPHILSICQWFKITEAKPDHDPTIANTNPVRNVEDVFFFGD